MNMVRASYLLYVQMRDTLFVCLEVMFLLLIAT